MGWSVCIENPFVVGQTFLSVRMNKQGSLEKEVDDNAKRKPTHNGYVS